MTPIEVPEDLSGLDERIAQVPNSPAVFLLWPREGDPYLAKTALLRRRLLRLLKEREKPPGLAVAARFAAPAQGAREAVAPAQPPSHRAAHRVPSHRLGLRIRHPDVRTGAPPFSQDLPRSAEAAHAHLRQARAHQRVSAQPAHHPSRPRGNSLVSTSLT